MDANPGNTPCHSPPSPASPLLTLRPFGPPSGGLRAGLAVLSSIFAIFFSLWSLCPLWLISYFVQIRPPAGGFVAKISFATLRRAQGMPLRLLRPCLDGSYSG